MTNGEISTRPFSRDDRGSSLALRETCTADGYGPGIDRVAMALDLGQHP